MANYFSSKSEALVWVKSFLAATDSLTTTNFHKFFAPNSSLKFANRDEIYGLQAIKPFFEPQFLGLESMKHEPIDIDLTPTKIHHSCNITYVLKGDPEHKKITISGFSTFFLRAASEEAGEEGKVVLERFQVWLDPAPIGERRIELAALAVKVDA